MVADTKAHKRANTYEGPQMNFKFPSDEDFTAQNISRDDEVELTGPKIEPYYKYEEISSKPASEASHNMIENAQQEDHQHHEHHPTLDPAKHYEYTGFGAANIIPEDDVPDHSEYQAIGNFQQHQKRPSNISSAFTSNYTTNASSNNDFPFSIPTQDNTSYQITNNLSEERLVRSPASLALSRSFSRGNSIRRNTSLRRNNSSLYQKASLKRSKAVRYKIGWLTRLRQMGVNIKNKIKSWRKISLRKAFNTKGTRFNKRSIRKKKISMPLERERAKSISELKREINNWYVPERNFTVGSFVEPLPPQSPRVVSNGSTTTLKRAPPPLPPHRVASSPMLKAQIDAENKSKHSMNRSFSTPTGVEILQEIPKVQPNLLQPEVKSSHPYHQLASTEDITNPHITGVIYDEEDEVEYEEDYYQVQEQEDTIRDLWRTYLRRTIAARIESKLEIHYIAQIPEDDVAQEYADNVFGLHSDNDSAGDSISDFDDADDESLTSVSGSEFSDVSGSQVMSDTSTNYFSTYSDPIGSPPPLQLSRESYNFIQAQLRNVKRSSTLPNRTSNDRLNHYRGMTPLHNRYMSVAV